MHSAIRRQFVVAAIVLSAAVAFCVDAPDLQINAVSGLIEVVDASWSGSNYNVRYTQVLTNGDSKESTLLSSHSANDNDPRITSAPDGETVVVWWRDLKTDLVIYRRRTLPTGAWGSEITVGRATESGSRPRVVFSDGDYCIAYQIQNSRSRSIGVQIIDDDPEPFRAIVATTTYTGDLDIQVDAEMNHLWVTWIDSASNVGYSEFDAQSRLWALTTFEPFGADSVQAARARIRAHVLNLADLH